MIRMKAGTSSQKLMLFKRGNAMSGAPTMIGTNQLPNPPIIAGMTTKKIMIRPCAVTVAFQDWPEEKYFKPGLANSMRMWTDKATPTIPAMIAKTR